MWWTGFFGASLHLNWQTHCNLSVGKGDEDINISQFTNTNVDSLLHFLSRRRQKEEQYESWVHCDNWTKRNNMSKREREQIQALNFLCFYCSFNILVYWFHFDNCGSGVTPCHFRAHTRTGDANFGRLHVAISSLQLTVFTSSRLPAIILLKPSRLLTSAWCQKEEYVFSHKFLRGRFRKCGAFSGHFNYRSN